jgi:hypothetical protein
MKNIATEKIVAYFRDAHLTYRQIAAITGLSPAAIGKRLKSAGVSATDGTSIHARCAFCNREIIMPRSIYLRSNVHFCNRECKAASMVKGKELGIGESRIARAIVSQTYRMKEGEVVVFKNGVNQDFANGNLLVVKDQKDAARFYQGKKVKIVWQPQAE